MKVKEIVPAILNRIEQESAQGGLRPQTQGIFRVSEVGKCERAIQYSHLRMTAEIPRPEVQLIFHDGNMHHDSTRTWLSKIGTLTHVETGISWVYDWKGEKITLVGTIDGNFEGMVVDIKSMNTYAFKWRKREFYRKYPAYVWQLNTYMDIAYKLGIIPKPKGFFLLKDKNTGQLDTRIQKYDPNILNLVLERTYKIQVAIKTGKILLRPYARNSFQCKTCSYRNVCWGVPMEQKAWT